VATFEKELKGVSLFSDLNQRQLRKLSRFCQERKFRPGMTVLREGLMSGVSFFVIVEGEATVSVNGNELGRLEPGDHFGELALITEQARTATVTAATELRCLTMAMWHFQRFLKDNPDTAWKLIQHLGRELVEARSTGQSPR